MCRSVCLCAFPHGGFRGWDFEDWRLLHLCTSDVFLSFWPGKSSQEILQKAFLCPRKCLYRCQAYVCVNGVSVSIQMSVSVSIWCLCFACVSMRCLCPCNACVHAGGCVYAGVCVHESVCFHAVSVRSLCPCRCLCLRRTAAHVVSSGLQGESPRNTTSVPVSPPWQNVSLTSRWPMARSTCCRWRRSTKRCFPNLTDPRPWPSTPRPQSWTGSVSVCFFKNTQTIRLGENHE